MKKLIYFFALLGIVSMASCSGKSNNASTTEVVMVTDSLVPDTGDNSRIRRYTTGSRCRRNTICIGIGADRQWRQCLPVVL